MTYRRAAVEPGIHARLLARVELERRRSSQIVDRFLELTSGNERETPGREVELRRILDQLCGPASAQDLLALPEVGGAEVALQMTSHGEFLPGARLWRHGMEAGIDSLTLLYSLICLTVARTGWQLPEDRTIGCCGQHIPWRGWWAHAHEAHGRRRYLRPEIHGKRRN